jgi:hypothetical protein
VNLRLLARRHSTPYIVVLALLYGLLFMLGSGCADGGAAGGGSDSRVTGLLGNVELWPDGDIRSITVETADAEAVVFTVELTDPTSIDGAHLQLHLEEHWPVAVTFGGSGDRRVAYAIDDAPE